MDTDANANITKDEVSPEDVKVEDKTSSRSGTTPAMTDASIKRTDINRTKRPGTDRLSLSPLDESKHEKITDKTLPMEELGEDMGDDLKTWFNSVKGGDAAEVKELITEGNVDPNVKNDNGMGALHLASASGDLAMVECLLENGAEVDITAKKGETPLMYAVLAKHPKIVKKLIEAGADVNKKPNDYHNTGSTALHDACQNADLEIVEILLENGADVKLTRKSGNIFEISPLHDAAESGNSGIVKALIDKEADSNVESSDALTPLHKASQCGHVHVVKVLIECGADLNKSGDDGKGIGTRPIHLASEHGKHKVVEALLEGGANVDDTRVLQGRSKVTSLQIATRRGHDKIVEVLIENNCDVNAQDRDGFTALHQACRYGHISVARILIAANCELDLGATSKQAYNQTPLHYAVRHGHTDIAKLLIGAECDINKAEHTIPFKDNKPKKKKVPTATLR